LLSADSRKLNHGTQKLTGLGCRMVPH
jgi:hypothetical protein